MRDEVFAIGLMVVLLGCCFYSGRLYERRDWYKKLPESMSLLCVECKQLGEDQVLSRIGQ